MSFYWQYHGWNPILRSAMVSSRNFVPWLSHISPLTMVLATSKKGSDHWSLSF